MYGDAYVDGRLGDAGSSPQEGRIGVPLKDAVGPNRNLAAIFVPDPDD